MEYFYRVDGKSVGPVARDVLTRLFADRTISLDTPIWETGAIDWCRLRDMPEAELLIGVPLPPKLSATANPATPPPPPVFFAGHDPYAPVVPPILVDCRPAGPWSRFFARLIDTMLLLTLIVLLILVSLRTVLPLDLPSELMPATVSSTLILPIAAGFLLHSGIIALFGNSIGKAIFGIRAVPLNRLGRPSFTGALAREFRVLVEGLAFYMPVASQVTMFAAWRDLKKGQPTRYDRSRAIVIDQSGTTLRRSVGIAGTVVVVTGLALTASGLVPALRDPVDRAVTDLISAINDAGTVRWENPETGVTTNLPFGWANVSTGETSKFYNQLTREFAFLSCEMLTTPMSLDEYGDLLIATFDTVEFGSEKEMSGDILLLSGRARDDETLLTYAIGQADRKFCHIEYQFRPGPELLNLNDKALTAALFEAALPKATEEPQPAQPPVISQPKPQPLAPKPSLKSVDTRPMAQWTNPKTGIIVTIPAEWKDDGPFNKYFVSFENDQRGANVLMDCAASPAISPVDFSKSVIADTSISWQGPFLPSPDPAVWNVWIASGVQQESDLFHTYVVGKISGGYCTIIFFEDMAGQTEHIDDPVLTKALLKSMEEPSP